MADTLIGHGTSVEVNVGQRVGTSWTGTLGAIPSHVEDLVRSLDPTISTDQNGHAEGSEFHVRPHPCTT